MTEKKLLLVVLVLALLVRLPHIADPILDWHSFRQADTASVTLEYVKNGVDILRPQFHDLSNIASGKDNLMGFRMVEFPWIQATLATILRALPFLPLEATSRLFTVFFSLFTAANLYYLVKIISNKKTALLTLVTFAFLPYAVFYSRVVLPDPILLSLSTGSITFFAYWLRKNNWWLYLASFLLLGLAALTKPFVVFLAPIYLSLLILQLSKHALHKQHVLGSIVLPLSFVPLLWWRDWITQFPSGIPASDWLYNGPIDGKTVRFRPVWFRWLGYERLIKLILGYAGALLIAAAFFRWKKLLKSELLVYTSWWLSIGIYFAVIARGNIQHDYYQILAIPIICISVARGTLLLYDWLKPSMHKKAASLTVSSLYILMLLISYSQIKEYYKINHWEYVRAGQRVQELVPTDGRIIAPAFGDTSFLLQTERRGWPIGFEIDKKIALGAQYYVTTSYDDEARMLESQYETLDKTPEYLILNLQKKI